MFRSLEARWFYDTVPFEAGDHFNNSHAQKQRTDWYATPTHEGCGIKTREGNLETKLRINDLGVREIDGVIGRVDEWIKWSLRLPAQGTIPTELLAANGWIAVTKRRFLRAFEVVNEEVTEVTGYIDTNGCQFEWTEIELEGKMIWTIGFEAFGEQTGLRSSLESVMGFLVSDGLSTEYFDEASSCAYPEWLSSLG